MSHAEASVRSYGGNGGLVTGSRHVYERGNEKIIVDFGMFQGREEICTADGKQRNSESISESCRGVSDILITHGHIDHMGLLPLVFKNGFTPNVYATRETFELMKVKLQNSAEIQAKDKDQILLYTMEDVDNCLRHIKIVEYFEEFGIGNRHSKITAQFIPNGHINGSGSVLIKDGGTKKNTLLTGDIGRPEQLMCGGYNEYADKFPDYKIHTIVTESTCSENVPISFTEREANLFNAVNKTAKRGGVSVVTTIADRMAPTREMFHNAQEYRGMFLDFDFYVDGPLPRKVMRLHEDLGPDFLTPRYGDNPRFYKTNEESMARFNLRNLTMVESHEQSKLLAQKLAFSSEKAVVLASGGMCVRGRSVNYIDSDFNKNPNNSIILTSFQVRGTRGAEMVEKSQMETGERKTAEVIWVDGNSSHAMGHELIDFYKLFNLNYLENFDIGHGRDSARKTLRVDFAKEDFSEYVNIVMPGLRQAITC